MVDQKYEIKLFKNISKKSSFYFVNSFYCLPNNRSLILGVTEYGVNFCSILVKDNIVATQFHPEKSGQVGQQFIKNFIKLI
jgi:glutamine amidotransferase